MKQGYLRPTEEAYAELQTAYDYYNDHLFASQERLPACMITYQREKRTMGYFSQGRFIRKDGNKADEIAMNPDYFAVIPLVEILQTLVHEMTHLWQAHFGKPSRSGYHNWQWARKMEALGLMPSDTGQPGGKKIGQSMNDYVIPGGRFDKATRRLLGTGFAISWMDRFPISVRPLAVLAPNPAPTGVGESCAHAPALVVHHTAASAVEPILLDGMPEVQLQDPPHAPLIDAAYQAPTIQGLDMGIREQADRSNREKYSCPTATCKTNVWGKPGLRLICEPCGLRLIPKSAGPCTES
ncbi:SprT-like domain-containing protein [Pseudomonas monteilii]|uniref:SprT-like domain-containing protein n=1 Tax=Pseudomonas monteilii TaxID=76759 RepID=UPI0015F8E65A|nr:SprT-like domain-containing protein [Pseudomonas monteilii]MBA6105245.1 SprT-like domain-containing protein [Pseudomonas monteilii]